MLTYIGGTKTLGQNEDGFATLAFDIGGHRYGDMADEVFKLLEAQNVPTHRIAYKPSTATMTIVRAEYMPRLEWHCHWRAHNNLLHTYKLRRPLRLGEPFVNPCIEIISKTDRQPMSLTMVGGFGILPGNQAHCFGMLTNSVVDILHAAFLERGLDLWHVRLEWAVHPEKNTPMLVDAISPLECIASLVGSPHVLSDAEVADQFLNSSQQIQ